MKIIYKINDNIFKHKNDNYTDIYIISLFHHSYKDIINCEIYLKTELFYNKNSLNHYYYSSKNDYNFTYISYEMLNSENDEMKDKIKEEIILKFSEIYNDNIKKIEEEKNKILKTYDDLLSNNQYMYNFSKYYIRNEKINKLTKINIY